MKFRKQNSKFQIMIKKITPILIALISISSFSQKSPKVDLDRFYFDVKFQNLPTENISFENRTYATRVNLVPSVYDYYPDVNVIKNRLYIKGWKNTTTSPTVSVDFNITEFSQKSTNIVNRLVEEKDKDGKVTKSYYMYTAVVQFYGNGIAVTNGPKSTIQVEPKKAEDAPKEANRFLQNKVAKTEEVPSTGSQNRINLATNIEYRSGESTNYKEIENYYNINKNEIFNQKLREFIDRSIQNTNYSVNRIYGFEPVSNNEKVWIMDAKDDEGATQKEAMAAVKVYFSEIQADKPIDDAIKNLQPLVEYFESLKTKYPDDNKGSRKIRYSAYYNLAKIYLYTDQPEKAIKEGEGLIANDYDKSDGKDIIKDAEFLINIFAKTGFKTRHNPSLN
jgi:hypothetical protein